MKLLLFLVMVLFAVSFLNAQSTKQTLSVLAIGNGHYVQSKWTMPEINFSASSFLNSFKNYSTPCLLQSSEKRILTKAIILDVIQSFVDVVQNKEGELNLGIIYYCGHGIASLQGSLYFIPGDLEMNTDDTTVTALSEQLLNIDEIKKIIVKAQMGAQGSKQSRYFILGDCCSNQVSSKWYEGISYRFHPNGLTSVEYDSAFLHRKNKPNSLLEFNAGLAIDSTGNLIVPPIDTSKGPMINEIPDVGELIRSMTFSQNGNMVYYSSKMGEPAELTACPKWVRNPNYYEIGPMCRRTLLFFNKKKVLSLPIFFEKLTDKKFDPKTQPVELNPSRNAGPEGEKKALPFIKH